MPTSKHRAKHRKKAAARRAAKAQQVRVNEKKMQEMIEHLKAQAKATFDEAKRKNEEEE